MARIINGPKVVLVAGTGSWDNKKVDWYYPSSPFVRYLREHNVEPVFDTSLRVPGPFVWSTDLGGVPFISRGKFINWAAGGAALAYFVVAQTKLPGQDTNIICHSHGLQVVLFACRDHDLKINNLVSLGSPVRKDMQEIAAAARENIRWWTHVYSDESDHWQWLGELFDGHLGIVRKHPLASLNLQVPRRGHSDLLRVPTAFGWWSTHMNELL